MTAASPAEWAAAGFLGLSAIGVIALAAAFADTNLAYFDPRRVDESERAIPVLLLVGPALYDVRRSLVDAGRDVAALVILLTTSPKGAMA